MHPAAPFPDPARSIELVTPIAAKLRLQALESVASPGAINWRFGFCGPWQSGTPGDFQAAVCYEAEVRLQLDLLAVQLGPQAWRCTARRGGSVVEAPTPLEALSALLRRSHALVEAVHAQ